MDTIGDLYDKYIINESEFSDAQYFYGKIPKTYGEAVEVASKLPRIKHDHERTQKLKNVLLEYHRKLGILTQKVERNINSIDEGVVLAGQQATIFGGSGIIGNKIASIVNISEISSSKNKLVPVFLVNTHDSIQPEITTIHLPNNQSSNSKPISLTDIHEGIISKTIRTDDYTWLDENLSIIKNIFSEFKTSIDKESRKLFSEKVDHILTYLRETYRTANNIGEWITLIWGIQSNIINDWGVVFLPSTHREIRELTLDGYIPFLLNRQDYINEFNGATTRVKQLGLKPTTVEKKNDFSPFFYECPECGHRVTLTCQEKDNELSFSGICPLEKKRINFVILKDKLDLTPYANNLVPRLDTNQALLQSILPVYIRISGPGEINYNAQVIPAARKIGIHLPIYVKYTRILYNTPWIEKMSKEPALEACSLFTNDFFKLLGSLAKARRKKDVSQLANSSNQITSFVLSKMKESKLIKEQPTHSIEKYKSWQFGMYDSNHQWQEVSWVWFVMASITGLGDYLDSYKRYSSAESSVGGIGYINSML